ncbi:MAG: hypothetical protein AAGK71_01475 [Pseudomonadota bacterium]
MSDRFLVVIPADPHAEMPATANALRDALENLADTDEARLKDYGKLQFIDAGKLAESVTCPKCSHGLPAEEWRNWMNRDWHAEDGFHLHEIEVPCCGEKMTLNDLSYDAPQGFARWIVSARVMERGLLNGEELKHLEKLAGIPLTAIAQEY